MNSDNRNNWNIETNHWIPHNPIKSITSSVVSGVDVTPTHRIFVTPSLAHSFLPKSPYKSMTHFPSSIIAPRFLPLWCGKYYVSYFSSPILTWLLGLCRFFWSCLWCSQLLHAQWPVIFRACHSICCSFRFETIALICSFLALLTNHR